MKRGRRKKEKRGIRGLSFLFSIILIIISSSAYFAKNPYWFYGAVVGVWLFFDNLSFWRGNKTTLDMLIQGRYRKFSLIFIALAIFGSLIEIIGNGLLDFWDYSYLSPFTIVITTPLVYPFILMSFREMFSFIHSFFRSYPVAVSVVLSMLSGIVIWETPNVYSMDWIYEIPFMDFSIFQINIAVIIGWAILILGPIYLYELVERFQ